MSSKFILITNIESKTKINKIPNLIKYKKIHEIDSFQHRQLIILEGGRNEKSSCSHAKVEESMKLEIYHPVYCYFLITKLG